LGACLLCFPAAAQYDPTGLTLLRSATTNVDGAGITVAQAEASLTEDLLTWEVNPANAGQPALSFTFGSALGTTNVYPNALGADSWHADDVANNFYGIPNGIATNVARVDNYEADYFYTNYVANSLLPPLGDAVVNQSFTFGNVTTNVPTPTNELAVSDQQQLDSEYDDYAVANSALFVSAINNGGSVSPPGTSYNCIGVGAFGDGSYSSIGPTLDNGRCKPDIVAPAGFTSFSTPQVSGAAAALMQAALRGDGGSDTNSAFDGRTIKALLLNGAVKPAGWTNSSGAPLDLRYGAGVLNVFNAYEQLAGGKHGFVDSGMVPAGTPHPPTGAAGSVPGLSGWDFAQLASQGEPAADAVNHYFFNATNSAGNNPFTATITLVWNRQLGEANINQLALFLFDAANSNLVACSTSLVDNVQHVFLPQLPAGRYDVQVWKAGGTNAVSDVESYALAWEFDQASLQIMGTGTNYLLTWPLYPAGFHVESATNMDAPAWQTNNLPGPAITNHQNEIVCSPTNNALFFRLTQP
jgi:hypothetical protein